MASAIYPLEPGSKYGPCAGTCSHTDCAEQRADAAKICQICGAPIGYGNRTYMRDRTDDPTVNEITFVHALCLETQQDLELVDPEGLEGAAWEVTRRGLAANFTKPK